jgi:TPR repeat protein
MMGIPGVRAPDPETGLAWFRKSAAQGNPAGIQNVKLSVDRSAASPSANGIAGARAGH